MKRNLDERNGAFLHRHVGPSPWDVEEMLRVVGAGSLDSFIAEVVPAGIRSQEPLHLRAFPQALSENEALRQLREIARGNKLYRSFIGMGYYRTVTPAVIRRNILENPSWYTHYTPYQPEISQGRLEALLNFQTVIADLTGLPVANASLLDEATAAAEAMAMAYAVFEGRRHPSAQGAPIFQVSEGCHPQTVAVVRTRAEALGIQVRFGKINPSALTPEVFGVLLQYPDTYGRVEDLSEIVAAAHQGGALAIVAADLMALAVLKSPGEFGADICLGSAQRFGVPMGFGGPHAAFLSVREDYKRLMPGRLVGISRDASGQPAFRLALQTREQHIRREKATSNICTAQVLLAVMASMYAVYHGPRGLRRIAAEIHEKTRRLADTLRGAGVVLAHDSYFDTLVFEAQAEGVLERAEARQINLRRLPDGRFGLSLDEPATERDVADLAEVITGRPLALAPAPDNSAWPVSLNRATPYLDHPVFNRYHSETEFLRYVKRLEKRDLSLADAMIPLGSCTMKLNASSEMIPITWSEFADLHPFVPSSQAQGYARIFSDLESALCDITGFDAVSLQPNAGSQGELAGLLVIRAFQRSRGEGQRNVCLIPRSAHGTNPASAVMAGLEVVVVECDNQGNIDLADLRAKVTQHGARLSALMVTYPSTHGVFEEAVREICELVHSQGGQVYMDGANLNAQVGLCQPAAIGADVCHINLHKTFCIPHGGGGPGMGPIGVKSHLAPFLPGHPIVALGHAQGIGAVSAAPWGSPAILPIPWMYMAMMGGEGLTQASKVAILNANYVAFSLQGLFPVLYRGAKRYVAHECILDVRPAKRSAGIEADDIAKRLMDYGFHAPTVSFPVAGTLMIEPTESESKIELDRFCEAMRAIHSEIQAIVEGRSDPKDNPLKNAPHTAAAVCRSAWEHPYSREQAAFPSDATRLSKFWPSVSRIDNVYGDRNLICTCPPMESYAPISESLNQ